MRGSAVHLPVAVDDRPQADLAQPCLDEHRLHELSPRLRETAELRLRHPSLPLRELGLKCRPAVSKAAVHRRLRKLIELAET